MEQDAGNSPRPRRRTVRPALETDGLRVPPHSVEAEQAVLGGLLLDNSTWDTIADRLGPEDFYRRDHQLIFGGIAELSARSEPSDAVTPGSPASTVSTRTRLSWPRFFHQFDMGLTARAGTRAASHLLLRSAENRATRLHRPRETPG